MAEENKIEEEITPVEGVHFNPLGSKPAITSESLADVEPIDFKEAEPTPPFPVADLETEPLQLTRQEQKAQSKSDELQALTRELVGESAFRAGEEERVGLSGLERTQTDLTSQLKAVQAEAKAIPLQVEQEFTGRASVGVMGGKSRARLRENAIQALSVSSLLEASRGNIGLAHQQVDRAVAQKYDPIREQIAVTQRNLGIIMQSPEYSLQDRNRAQAQLDQQNIKLERLAEEEANDKEIKNMAVTAAQAGMDSSVLKQIQDARSPEEALRIATEAGVFQTTAESEQFTLKQGDTRFDSAGNVIAFSPKEAEEQTELERLNVESKKLDIAKKIDELNTKELSSKTISQIDKLSTSFDNAPIVKNFNEVQNKKLSIDAIVENGVGGPADLALVFEFMKALDPTSVVRESEYDSAARSGNIFAGWATKFNGYLKAEGGMLPQAVKNEFKRLSGDKFDIITSQYNNLRDEKSRLINQKTGDDDGSDYLIDYNFTNKPQQFNSLQDWSSSNPGNMEQINQLIIDNDYDEAEALQIINRIEERKKSGFKQEGNVSLNAQPGTAGNLPQRNLNPGNVKRGGIGDKFAIKENGKPKTDSQGHLVFASPEDGFNALKADLDAKINGRSRVVKSPNPTIAEVGRAYAEDPNWAKGVARLAGVNVNDKAQKVSFDKLLKAIATQEGYYA